MLLFLSNRLLRGLNSPHRVGLCIDYEPLFFFDGADVGGGVEGGAPWSRDRTGRINRVEASVDGATGRVLLAMWVSELAAVLL